VAKAAPFEVRPARDEDRMPLAIVFATVAEERDGIATEPPVDVDARAASWTLEGTLVAVADTELVGSVHVAVSRFGFGEIGMAVAREWRGRGVGSALLTAAIEWSRGQGLHKLSLQVFPTQRRCDCALPQVRVRRRGSPHQTNPSSEWRAVGRSRDGPVALRRQSAASLVAPSCVATR
jgi:GNAT superfamily N-acetyltransferase